MISKLIVMCLCQIIATWCKVVDIQSDCENVEALCPGEVYTHRCTPTSNVAEFLEVTITGGNCTHNKYEKIEFDYHVSDNFVNETVVDEKCGNITGTLIPQNNSLKSIDTTFQASEYINNAQLRCLALAKNNTEIEKVCNIRLAGPPSPPANISFSDCMPTLISWEPPSVLRGQADKNLKYLVTFQQQFSGTIRNFTVEKTFMLLDKEKIDTVMSYNVCVAALNCIGMSTPVCKEKQIVPNLHLPAPLLNVSIVNSSAVRLAWKTNTSNDDEICYDIERNYKIEHQCISGTNASINVICKKEELIHNFRVRASRLGIMPGKWSNPVCITFAPPLPLLFVNHTIIKSNPRSNMTLKLSIQLQDRSQAVGICHIAKVRGVEVTVKRDEIYHKYTIPENEMKYEVNFTLAHDNEENEFMISARPLSKVGPGPEQVTFVHLTGGGYVSTCSFAIIIGALILCLLMQLN